MTGESNVSHPRDPRLRRQAAGGAFAAPVDVAAAAVRLEVAADAMRAQHRERGPEQLAAAVQFAPVEPPMTAAEFAAALDIEGAEPLPGRDYDLADVLADLEDVAASPPPAPVESLPPAPPAPVFRSERALTWRSRHDVRSLSYGIRPTLPGSAPLADRMWPVGPVLDQGTEGQCVGCAVVDAWNAMHPADTAGPLYLEDAGELYHRAQELDAVPGEDYSGTSVLAGMQAAVEAGLFGGYRWAFGTRDVAQAVLQVGTVVVGVPWLSGMYDTGPGGLVTLAGEDRGMGHCLAVVGLRLKGPQGQPGPFFVWQNSWGSGYGDGGLGYIHHRDLAELLHGVGEAAIPTAGPQHV
jgi:hypothetical protein